MSKQNEIIKVATIANLVEMWEITSMARNEESPMVREWIMDELEIRDSLSFGRWMRANFLENIDSPRNFFMN